MTTTSDETQSPAIEGQGARKVSRRSVLTWIGIGAGTAAIAAGTSIGVRAASNGAFTAGLGTPYALWRDWAALSGVERVVAAGVLACNPHNTQPWRLGVSSEVIQIRSDPSRRMPINDASDREHFAGLGCAIENMMIAASAAGLGPSLELLPEGQASDLVATITLRGSGAGSAADAALGDAIPLRHTNRGQYTGEPIGSDVLAALSSQTSEVNGTGLVLITDPDRRGRLGALYVAATEAIISDTAQSEEAFSWFRNDRAEIDQHRDGLTLDGQGLGELTLLAAKILPAQSRTDGDAFWLKATRDVHTATAAAYGVITVDDVFDRAAQITGGRLLARLHLAATSLGLGFHHMNQITERIDRDRSLGRPDAFSARWAEIIGRPASTGLVSFRIGRAVREAGLSPRRNLTDMVSAP